MLPSIRLRAGNICFEAVETCIDDHTSEIYFVVKDNGIGVRKEDQRGFSRTSSRQDKRTVLTVREPGWTGDQQPPYSYDGQQYYAGE